MLHHFFTTIPALSTIFSLGMEPTEELFSIVPEDQHARLEAQGFDPKKRWHYLIPRAQDLEAKELMLLTEEEKQALFDAAGLIEKMCTESQRPFASYTAKLEYVAGLLPPVITEGTRYETAPCQPTRAYQPQAPLPQR